MTNRLNLTAVLLVLGATAVAGDPVLAAAPAGPPAATASAYASADTRPPVTFGWRIASGTWDGQVLDGLTVAALIYQSPPAADGVAVVTVDLRATAAQRAALVSLARELSGGRIGDIARVQSSVIRFGATTHYEPLRAEELLQLTARRSALASRSSGR